MSLPSIMEFYKNGKVVATCSCNIGWTFEIEYIPGTIIRAINQNQEFLKEIQEGKHTELLERIPKIKEQVVDLSQVDFDFIELYGYVVSYNDMAEWVKDKSKLNELVSKIIEVKDPDTRKRKAKKKI